MSGDPAVLAKSSGVFLLFDESNVYIYVYRELVFIELIGVKDTMLSLFSCSWAG